MSSEQMSAKYPLSRDEQAAVARCVADIRKQLQGMSELFSSRYGKESSLAELSAKALVCTAILQDELSYAEIADGDQDPEDDFAGEESVIVKTAYQGK
jgi:hypothetical protein